METQRTSGVTEGLYLQEVEWGRMFFHLRTGSPASPYPFPYWPILPPHPSLVKQMDSTPITAKPVRELRGAPG